MDINIKISNFSVIAFFVIVFIFLGIILKLNFNDISFKYNASAMSTNDVVGDIKMTNK